MNGAATASQTPEHFACQSTLYHGVFSFMTSAVLSYSKDMKRGEYEQGR
jgi:hypothetical protein